MAEAAFALCTATRHADGRVTYARPLLDELGLKSPV